MTHAEWGSDDVARAWARGADVRRATMAPATERMLDEARLEPGARVLEVGAGMGEVALLAAQRVGPLGRVVATDPSSSMVARARQWVEESGAGNVEVRVANAERLAFPKGAFDAVIARNVLMFVDLPRALASIRAVVRSGGRLAAVVWSAVERNPFQGIVLDAASRKDTDADGEQGVPQPEMARAFSCDTHGYGPALERAGFRDVVVHIVGASRRFASVAEAVEAVRDQPISREPIESLPEGARADAWREIEARFRAFDTCSGGCVFPMESLVIAATA